MTVHIYKPELEAIRNALSVIEQEADATISNNNLIVHALADLERAYYNFSTDTQLKLMRPKPRTGERTT